ncbi:MAG: hypothetical protein JG776_1071 [Caloramator sp.]|uniref:hypothetical protein n=1 Tax=Caloramator sp. TaxID=1871330 RepID=UPI001DCB5D1D|nr:hypothetical protein [Caloramator sp.]MBZ4663369.1 hypothetical protein [Caloramator sp.]
MRAFRYRKFRFRINKINSIFSFIFKLYFFIFIICLVLFFIVYINYKSKPYKSTNIVKIKRSEAYKRGMEMINFVWKYDASKNGVVDNNEVTMPRHLRDGELTSGIPYCWGGYISLDISNQPQVKDFKDALDKGLIAGNINTNGGYKPLTAGLDCSGFVGAVYKLPIKVSTQMLDDYFHPIKFEDLKPMDIINHKKYHVFIYLKESADKKGIIVMEATTGKYVAFDRTTINYRSYSEIKKYIEDGTYIPMRYNRIVEDKVELFRDKYEFNNFDYLATNIILDEDYQGYIDYAGDVDIYSLKLNKANYNISFKSDKPIYVEAYSGENNIISLYVDKYNECNFSVEDGQDVKIKVYSKKLEFKFKYQFNIKIQ